MMQNSPFSISKEMSRTAVMTTSPIWYRLTTCSREMYAMVSTSVCY